VKQIKSQSFEEVQHWIETELKATAGDFKVIVKPIESAGSENVALCGNPEEVKVAFDKILGKINGLGLVNNVISTYFVRKCLS
jgi:glutathione synthase/RimK-type ligase-like ATP-grasp enzyme